MNAYKQDSQSKTVQNHALIKEEGDITILILTVDMIILMIPKHIYSTVGWLNYTFHIPKPLIFSFLSKIPNTHIVFNRINEI